MKYYWKCYLCGSLFQSLNDRPPYIVTFKNGHEEGVCVDCFRKVIEEHRNNHIKE